LANVLQRTVAALSELKVCGLKVDGLAADEATLQILMANWMELNCANIQEVSAPLGDDQIPRHSSMESICGIPLRMKNEGEFI